MVRRKMYSVLQDLLAPKKPQDKLLPVLFQELKEHYKSQPLVITENFTFIEGAKEQTSPSPSTSQSCSSLPQTVNLVST